MGLCFFVYQVSADLDASDLTRPVVAMRTSNPFPTCYATCALKAPKRDGHCLQRRHPEPVPGRKVSLGDLALVLERNLGKLPDRRGWLSQDRLAASCSARWPLACPKRLALRQTWLGMQTAYDLWRAQQRAKPIKVERFTAPGPNVPPLGAISGRRGPRRRADRGATVDLDTDGADHCVYRQATGDTLDCRCGLVVQASGAPGALQRSRAATSRSRACSKDKAHSCRARSKPDAAGHGPPGVPIASAGR